MIIKRSYLILFFLTAAQFSSAQNTVNYWMGGQHAMIKFDNQGGHYLYRPDDNLFWRTSASISDSVGNLLFYTNGYRVFNSDFQVMRNGDNLNIGDYVTWGYNLLSECDGACIVPVPMKSNQYYLFHFDSNDITTPDGPGLWTTHLFYCIIDMNLDNGKGGVIQNEKDIPILTDTLTTSGIKLVKHGNGRDWWLLCQEYGNNRYYRFLIDPYGIHGPYSQNIGIAYHGFNAVNASPMKFYSNDEKFVHVSYETGEVELCDFDRCSGELYNYYKFTVTDTPSYIGAVSFSPSNRYMYISSAPDTILQFDLSSSNIKDSKKVIGISDGVPDPFTPEFYYQELGPDGKIYVFDYNGCYSISIINNPDSSGLACNFVQRGFVIDSPGQWEPISLNVPNYSLGALSGSGCDSLSSIQLLPVPVFTFGVYPNPFSDQLNISVTGASTVTEIEVYNILGQRVYYNTQVPKDYFIHQTIFLAPLSAGMYFVNLKVNGEQYVQKVIKK